MNRNACFLLAFLVFFSAAHVFADDQEKAVKEMEMFNVFNHI
jgi:hypothetical protein